MEAFRSLALFQLLEFPDHLNGSEVAEWKCEEPQTTIDARGSNQWRWNSLNTEAQAHSCRLDAA